MGGRGWQGNSRERGRAKDSGTGEAEQGLEVVAVGGAQSLQVRRAGGPGGDHSLAPPTEFSAAQMDSERVGIEAGVPAVAIGEGMDQHELMMAAHRDFVGGGGGGGR